MVAEPAQIDAPAAQASEQAPAAQASEQATGLRAGRLCLPTIIIAGLAAYLSWLGWEALDQYGPEHTIWADQLELHGPAGTGLVLSIFLIEQVGPAPPRPLLARGSLLDMIYMLAHAVIVVPLIVLLGAGFLN